MDLSNPRALSNDIQRKNRILDAKIDLQLNVEILSSTISLLKDMLVDNQEKLKRITEISKHVMNLLNHYPTEDKKVNKYILESVTAVKFIVANLSDQKEKKPEESIHSSILVLGKLQDAILELVKTEETKISEVFDCERKIEEIIYYAEDSRFIDEVPENASWKKQFQDHRQRLGITK